MLAMKRKLNRLALSGILVAGLAATGIAAADNDVPGVTKNQILVGTLGPQTGPAAAYDGVRKGIATYFHYVNENGGVDGRKLKLIAYDDQYQPAKTVRLARRLVDEDHVFATLGDIGSPTNAAVKGYMEKKGVPMIMLCSAASQFFNPPIPNYMGSCIASYDFEGRMMVHYAIDKLHDKRIAIAYDNDDYGSPINDAADKALKNYKDAKLVATVNFQANDSDFSAQAQKLSDAKPDAILVFSTPSPAAHLKQALYNIGVNSGNVDYITTQEGGNDHVLFDLAGKNIWDGSYSMAAVPEPDTDSKAMKLFLSQFQKQFPNTPATGSPELGWASAQVFVEALKRTHPLTRENFLKSFYTFNNWKGSLYASIGFTKENHHGVNTMFFTKAENGKIVPVSGLISIDPSTGHFTEEPMSH